ncbi:MAG TPA: SAM-dependent methyltransferase [Gemmatimonadales bacterium]|nr:SAM-dependent methyltransferase [Gemmatimonadales bacterium]
MPPVPLTPVAYVRSPRRDLTDDAWGTVKARVELAEGFEADSLDGIEAFSHAEIIFVFDRVPESAVVRGARHPRGNLAWPRVGIFAQRGKDRPNRLGSTIVEIGKREGKVLEVIGLDAVDGTLVVDIKPVFKEFLPRTPVKQPSWASELMARYW